MRISLSIIITMLLASILTGTYAGGADDVVTREKAVAIARDYIAKNRRAGLYRLDNPIVTEGKNAFTVQFNMVKRNVRPGVCIVSVDRRTGAARIVPVE